MQAVGKQIKNQMEIIVQIIAAVEIQAAVTPVQIVETAV